MLQLLFGCASTDTPRAHVEAARVAERDPAAAARICERLPSKQAGECLALTVATVRQRDLAAAKSLCVRIDDELWSDECWFWIAEAQATLDGPASAVTTCGRAGRFARACVGHLWLDSATRLHEAWPEDPVRAWGLHEPTSSWGAGLARGADGSLAERHESTFFDARFNPTGAGSEPRPVDLSWCVAFGPPLARRCRQVGAATLQRQLNRAAIAGLDAAALCAEGDVAARVAAATGLSWIPHPSLDQRAAMWVDRACNPRPGGPR